jgi:Tol biopolymer transport system component
MRSCKPMRRHRDIWRVDLLAAPVTARPVRLISSSFPEGGPQYSRRRKIAFASSRSGHKETWVTGADGSHPVQLTFFRGRVRSSVSGRPTADRSVFISRPEGYSDIYLVAAAGGEPSRIEKHPQRRRSSVGRGGEWICFVLNRSGDF